MRFREAVALARRNGESDEDLRILRSIRSWEDFWAHPSRGAWLEKWIRYCIPLSPPGSGRRIVRIERIPSLAEEPSEGMRHYVAVIIQAERIERIPSPAEEPSEGVRVTIARRIPAERLDRMPTPAEEPGVGVRAAIACRIPAERLACVPTPAEESDVWVRQTIACRILAERLPDHTEEPS